MSEFEFIFTANTLILALVIARLLDAVRDTFDRRRRYWIHCLWVVNRLLLVLGALLTAYARRDSSDPGALFLLVLLTPTAVLFIQVNALVTSQPAAIESWEDHFWSARKWFFGANAFYVLGVFLLTSYSPDLEMTMSQRFATPTVGIALSTVGFISTSEKIHGLLAVVGVLNVAVAVARLITLA